MSEARRLFFALRPCRALRERLAAIAAGVTGGAARPVPADNIHLTLLFLGRIGAPVRECLETVASRAATPAFRLELERLGYWPRPAVLWSAPRETPAALAALAAGLAAGSQRCGVAPERRPFEPHVTLARKVRRGPALSRHEPLAWPVCEFHLMESLTDPAGARYRVLRSWHLERP